MFSNLNCIDFKNIWRIKVCFNNFISLATLENTYETMFGMYVISSLHSSIFINTT